VGGDRGGGNQKELSPPPLSSPIKGEEIVFDESQKPRLLRRGASLILKKPPAGRH